VLSHINCIIWSFKIIWGLKKILPQDRISFWGKSVNLYFAFIAFTDKERPKEQFHSAMVCAMLSSIYDYDTDFKMTSDPGNSLFVMLLEQYSSSLEAKQAAKKLFFSDLKKSLSHSGLERGGIALWFYFTNIKSQWMSKYTKKQILNFGWHLQILDDCLDYEKDKIVEDTNCFLSSNAGEKKKLCDRLLNFMASDFYKELEHRSFFYKLMKRKCNGIIKKFGPSFCRQLIQTSRPHTMLFAFIFTIVGFKLYHPFAWQLSLATSIAFAFITGSIMIFNDLHDRRNDHRKEKYFTSEHLKEVIIYWSVFNFLTLLFLFPMAYIDVKVALFCFCVWVIGHLYSYMQKWFNIQNLVVASCSASPVLCGALHYGAIRTETYLLFAIFMSLILMREIYKDIEDQKVDRGYKITIPIVLKYQPRITAAIISLLFLPAIFFALYPNGCVRIFGFVSLPFLQFTHAGMFFNSKFEYYCKKVLNWILAGTLILLFII